LVKSMYDQTTRDRYERRKEHPAVRPVRHPWIRSIGILSIISFVTSILTAYTTWIQQSDDVRIIWDSVGTIGYNFETDEVDLFSGNITLMNLGNRNAVIRGISLGYRADPEFIRRMPGYNANPHCFVNGRHSTNFSPIVLKPGEVSYVFLKLLSEGKEVESFRVPVPRKPDGQVLRFKDQKEGDRDRIVESCATVDFTTVDFNGWKTLIFPGALDFDSAYPFTAPPKNVDELFKNRRSPQSIVTRTRTTIPFINYALDESPVWSCEIRAWLEDLASGKLSDISDAATSCRLFGVRVPKLPTNFQLKRRDE
jgi:hypothetical protein